MEKKKTYYFDYGATSLKKPKEVAKKVYDVIASEKYANPSRGSYKEATDAFLEIYNARKKIANFFGLKDESKLIFTKNVTESLNIVIKGILQKGDHVITTSMEHNSTLRPIYQMSKTHAVEYSIVPSDEYGIVCYDKIEENILKNTRLIALTHASNVTGNIVDIKRISKICKKHNILLLVDAAQTAGVIDIDVDELGIDFLCFTGHKSLFGIQGIGGICINAKENIKRYNVGGSGIDSFSKEQPNTYPTKLEAGTLNTPGILSLVEGINYIEKKGIENLKAKQVSLAEKFYNALKEDENIIFYGDFNRDKCATVALNFKQTPSSDVAEVLAEEYGIAVRAGSHCAPLMHETLGTKEQGIVRFSFSSMNEEEEIDYAIKSLKEISKNL